MTLFISVVDSLIYRMWEDKLRSKRREIKTILLRRAKDIWLRIQYAMNIRVKNINIRLIMSKSHHTTNKTLK